MVYQIRALVRLAVGEVGGLRRWDWIVAPCESAVVEALCQENKVGDRIVDGKNDLLGA